MQQGGEQVCDGVADFIGWQTLTRGIEWSTATARITDNSEVGSSCAALISESARASLGGRGGGKNNCGGACTEQVSAADIELAACVMRAGRVLELLALLAERDHLRTAMARSVLLKPLIKCKVYPSRRWL